MTLYFKQKSLRVKEEKRYYYPHFMVGQQLCRKTNSSTSRGAELMLLFLNSVKTVGVQQHGKKGANIT